MSFFNDLFGSGGASRIQAAGNAAQTRLDKANEAATSYTQQGMDKAQGYFSPYADTGQRANAMYSNAMGLKGQQGGQDAIGAYKAAANPYFQQEQDRTTNALMRSYNARGMGSGGTAALAGARATSQLGYQDYQNWLQRLGGMQGQGVQVAGQQAGIAQQGYGNMANQAWGYGTTSAANGINVANGVNAARQNGVNNLLKGLGTVGGMAFSAFAPGASQAMGGVQYGGMSPGGVAPGATWPNYGG